MITNQPPKTDPSAIFEFFRGSYATELLVAAVAHFDLFGKLKAGTMSFDQLQAALSLQSRPLHVLLTAMGAMGLIVKYADGRFALSSLSREHLLTGEAFFVGDYLAQAAKSPGVVEMVDRLRTNAPAQSKLGGTGVSFIYRNGIESAMEAEESSRAITLALAGRAKNVAPVLAQRLDLAGGKKLLDLGGGTGIYSCALLQQHPGLRAIVYDRPQVLKIASEMAEAYGVADRLELVPGDMHVDPLPAGCDRILLSNILHDWDVKECEHLVKRCADALPKGGRLLIHDVFLNDDLTGPLPLALYSAALFTLTEGRAYSTAEYKSWLTAAGLKPAAFVPTLVHCAVLEGWKA